MRGVLIWQDLAGIRRTIDRPPKRVTAGGPVSEELLNPSPERLRGSKEKLGQAVVDGKSRNGCPVLTGRLIEDMGKVRGDRFLAED
jgi:hypothetical protein